MVESQQEAHWRAEVLQFFTRVLDVLHDISDTVHATYVLTEKQASSAAPARHDDHQDDDRLLTVEEVAELLGMRKSQLYNPAWRAKGPKAIHVGKRIMWRRKDLRRWLDSVGGLNVEPDVPRERALHAPRPQPRPVRSEDRPWCIGSGQEPMSAGAIKGTGTCRICKDAYVMVKKDGTLRKHRPHSRFGY